MVISLDFVFDGFEEAQKQLKKLEQQIENEALNATIARLIEGATKEINRRAASNQDVTVQSGPDAPSAPPQQGNIRVQVDQVVRRAAGRRRFNRDRSAPLGSRTNPRPSLPGRVNAGTPGFFYLEGPGLQNPRTETVINDLNAVVENYVNQHFERIFTEEFNRINR